MKRIIFILIIILLVNGCTNNKIICYSKTNSDGIKIIQNYKLTYEEKEITEFIIQKKYVFEDITKYNTFKVLMDKYKEDVKSLNNNISYTETSKNQKYSFKLTLDVSKTNNEELEFLGLNKNLSEFKKILEDQGLKCN